jgi:hypothetical protein
MSAKGTNGTGTANANQPATPKKKRSSPNAVLAGWPAPPNATAPDTPPAFDVNAPLGRGGNPWLTLVNLTPQIVQEIATSPTFVQDFGAKQSPQDLTSALQVAAAWRAKRNAAEKWAKYTKSNDGGAWRVALSRLKRFQKAFEAAVVADSKVAEQYPQTAEVFRTRSAAGARGAKTRAATKANDAALAAAKAEAKPASS